MDTAKNTPRLNIVVAGHVDHGKSTVIGRLLADTGSLPEGKLEAVQASCRRNGKPFEYAFLLDALKDEQAQGITIDSARVFFNSKKRGYIIIDAPGHIEFLKNMVTGASRAEGAFMVIDAEEGVQENSRRHGYLLGMLGVKSIVVLVNKMDRVNYDQAKFESVQSEYKAFLAEIGIEAMTFIPVSGLEGPSVARLDKDKLPWYSGPTVLEILDSFESAKKPTDRAFRMYVQDVYKFSGNGDTRRIVAGRVLAGRVRAGDEVIFYPSGKRSKVSTLEVFNAPTPTEAVAGESIGLTLAEQIFIKRGELAALASENSPPETVLKFRSRIFWMSKDPLEIDKDYFLKVGSAKVRAHLEKIEKVFDASSLSVLENRTQVERHEVAECIVRLDTAVAFDSAIDSPETGRFVLVDNHRISGGGLFLEAVKDARGWTEERIAHRNTNWQRSHIARESRAARYNQKAVLLLVTGPRNSGRRQTAKLFEEHLFNEGKFVYYLATGSVLHSLAADIHDQADEKTRREELWRLAETGHLLLDTGLILILSAQEMDEDGMHILETAVGEDRILKVCVGEGTDSVDWDLKLPKNPDPEDAIIALKNLLHDQGVIYQP